MLGLTSIQRTAHRMEDFFNIFRSRPGGVPVDQHLETLLLQAFDGLAMLLEELQSPRGLTEEVGNTTLAELEPVFQETERHIQNLLGEGPVSAPVSPPAARTLQQDMAEVVPQQLRQMLELFKRGEQPGVRDQLVAANAVLKEIGQVHHLAGWQQLTETFGQALGNPDADLRTLALVALRDLKQGQQLILAGQPEQVAPSPELQQLARPAAPLPHRILGRCWCISRSQLCCARCWSCSNVPTTQLPDRPCKLWRNLCRIWDSPQLWIWEAGQT